MQSAVLNTAVIGISGLSADSRSVQAMVARVREIGGTPIVLANHAKRTATEDIYKFDALILMGNDFDTDPNDYIHRYPEGDPRSVIHPKTKSLAGNKKAAARAVYEKQILALALEQKMPIFAICGGMQLVNVMLGGTLHQHIPDLVGHDKHASNAGQAAASTVIPVIIVPDTLLARAAKERSLYAPHLPPLISDESTVNAFHHQAVDWVGSDLQASAYSDAYNAPDGRSARLIEAIECHPNGKYKDQFLLGVQWHPEFLPDNVTSQRMLQDVKQAAIHYAQTTARTHAPEQAKLENVLSSLPELERETTLTQDHTSPTLPTKPRGRGR